MIARLEPVVERLEALSWRVAAGVAEGLVWVAEVLENRRRDGRR